MRRAKSIAAIPASARNGGSHERDRRSAAPGSSAPPPAGGVNGDSAPRGAGRFLKGSSVGLSSGAAEGRRRGAEGLACHGRHLDGAEDGARDLVAPGARVPVRELDGAEIDGASPGEADHVAKGAEPRDIAAAGLDALLLLGVEPLDPCLLGEVEGGGEVASPGDLHERRHTATFRDLAGLDERGDLELADIPLAEADRAVGGGGLGDEDGEVLGGALEGRRRFEAT